VVEKAVMVYHQTPTKGKKHFDIDALLNYIKTHFLTWRKK